MKTQKRFLTGLFILMFAALTALTCSASENNKTKEEQSDLWLKAKLVTTYTLNQHLNPFDMDVDVQDGVVTLGGAVESSVEKDLAEEIAMSVSGVKDVKNNLSIESNSGAREKDKDSESMTKEKSDFARAVKDATITAKVKSRLLWNTNTDGLEIDVDTENGVVFLNGTADSSAKKDLAVQIAQNTSGVKKVEDNLKVTNKEEQNMIEKGTQKVEKTAQKTKKEVSDAWITGKVKAVMISSKEADDADINVSTENKVVMLKGTVQNKEQKEKVIKLVSGVKGVKDVKADLKLKEK